MRCMVTRICSRIGKLKTALSIISVSGFLDFSSLFVLEVDSLISEIWKSQVQTGEIRVLAYASRKL